MTLRLYNIRVESEFVFLCDDSKDVESEFADALSTDFSMSDAVADGDIVVRPLTHLPSGYDHGALPWGEDEEGDRTIGELIDAGAAPEYVRLQEQLAASKAKVSP